MRFRLLTAALLACTALSAQTRGDIARIDSLLNCNPEQQRELTFRKANLLKRMYLFDEAAETLTSLLRPDRLDTEVLGEIADCHYLSGNTEDAARLYGILSQQLPDNLGFRVRYMNLAARAKSYASVIDEGRDFLQRDTLLPVLTLMGDAFQKTEQPDSALFYYQEALRRKPRNAAVVGKIADILLGRKAYDETLSLAEDYLSMDPDNIPVGKVKGLALYLKKQYDPSITAFEHVLEVGDDSYGTHYYLGHGCREFGLLREANEHFLKAWQIDSSDVALALSIAKLHSTPFFAQDADLWFKKALSMLEPDPEDLSMVYQTYGEAEYGHHNWDKALPLYKEAYKINPKNLSLISTIGYIYEQKKDYKSALEWYNRYLSLGKPGTKAYQFVEDSVRWLKAEKFMEE